MSSVVHNRPLGKGQRAKIGRRVGDPSVGAAGVSLQNLSGEDSAADRKHALECRCGAPRLLEMLETSHHEIASFWLLF